MRSIKSIDDSKESRNKLFKLIVNELLEGNIATNGYLGKKLKDMTTDYDVFYVILEKNLEYLKSKIPTISHPIGKINYIFATVNDQLYK